MNLSEQAGSAALRNIPTSPRLIRLFLCLHRITQREIARRAGYSEAYLSRLLHGKHPMLPRASRSLRLAIADTLAERD